MAGHNGSTFNSIKSLAGWGWQEGRQCMRRETESGLTACVRTGPGAGWPDPSILVRPIATVAHPVPHPAAGHHPAGLRAVEQRARAGRRARLVRPVLTVAIVVIKLGQRDGEAAVQTGEPAANTAVAGLQPRVQTQNAARAGSGHRPRRPRTRSSSSTSRTACRWGTSRLSRLLHLPVPGKEDSHLYEEEEGEAGSECSHGAASH